MTLLQAEREKAMEIDELYLYKVRKLIKRELLIKYYISLVAIKFLRNKFNFLKLILGGISGFIWG